MKVDSLAVTILSSLVISLTSLAIALMAAWFSFYIHGRRENQAAKISVLGRWAAWGGFTGYYGPRSILGEILIAFNDSSEVKKALSQFRDTKESQHRLTEVMCKSAEIEFVKLQNPFQ